MTLSLSGDIAASITAVGTLVTVIGNLVLQILQTRRSRENGRKIDENTALTRDTAAKVEVVHAATTAIQESTGTHQTLKELP
jgi:hypothetical protein